MGFQKDAKRMTQSQAIENIVAVFNSDYFNDYTMCTGSGTINSDLIKVQSLGQIRETGEKPSLEEISGVVTRILGAIDNQGTLHYLNMDITPTGEELKKMGLEQELVQNELELPISFTVNLANHGNNTHDLRIMSGDGTQEKWVEKYGANLQQYQQIVSGYHRRIRKALDDILPHQARGAIY